MQRRAQRVAVKRCIASKARAQSCLKNAAREQVRSATILHACTPRRIHAAPHAFVHCAMPRGCALAQDEASSGSSCAPRAARAGALARLRGSADGPGERRRGRTGVGSATACNGRDAAAETRRASKHGEVERRKKTRLERGPSQKARKRVESKIAAARTLARFSLFPVSLPLCLSLRLCLSLSLFHIRTHSPLSFQSGNGPGALNWPKTHRTRFGAMYDRPTE
eukprot:620075-Pleurochrysis_carterae.AAC.1